MLICNKGQIKKEILKIYILGVILIVIIYTFYKTLNWEHS
jgi:uncharacterized protein (UPF0333 family)